MRSDGLGDRIFARSRLAGLAATLVAGPVFMLSACVGGTASSGGGFASSGGNGATDTGSTTTTDTGSTTTTDTGSSRGTTDADGGSGSTGADAGGADAGGADAGGANAGVSDEDLKKYNVLKLAKQSDGAEVGSRTTDSKGIARFYSPTHKALLEIDGRAGIKGKEVPYGNAQVTVRVDSSGNVFALLVDPTGLLAPAHYAGPLKNGKVEASSEGSIADGKFDIKYDKAKSPFGTPKPFGLTGALVSMAISFTIRTALGMAIGSIIKNMVNKLCTFANPLYTNWCGNLADFAKEVTGVVMGGIWLKFAGTLTWQAAVNQVSNAAVSWLVQKGCEKATGALLVAMGPVTGMPANTLVAANLGLWKLVSHKLNYMQEKVLANPPANAGHAAMVKGIVRKGYTLQAVNRNMVQTDLYVAFTNKTKTSISSGKIFTFVMKAIEEIGNELKVHVTYDLNVVANNVTAYATLWKSQWTAGQKFKFERLSVKRTDQPWLPKGFSQAVSCSLGVIDGFGGHIQGLSTMAYNYNVLQFCNDDLKILNHELNETYNTAWGGTIATPTCFPDIFEPNNKFNIKQAVKNVGNKVTIDGLSMTKNDVDWFTLPLLGVWAKVQAGVAARKPAASNDCSASQLPAKLCVQMYWYSNIIELTGGIPVKIGSEHCGTIGPGASSDPQLSTKSWNVSKVTGETGQTLLIRVRQPTGQNKEFPYRAFMFAGGIF